MEDGEVPGGGWALDQRLLKVALTLRLWKGGASSRALKGLALPGSLEVLKGLALARGSQGVGATPKRSKGWRWTGGS